MTFNDFIMMYGDLLVLAVGSLFIFCRFLFLKMTNKNYSLKADVLTKKYLDKMEKLQEKINGSKENNNK